MSTKLREQVGEIINDVVLLWRDGRVTNNGGISDATNQIFTLISKEIKKNRPKGINDSSENYELGWDDALEEYDEIIADTLGANKKRTLKTLGS